MLGFRVRGGVGVVTCGGTCVVCGAAGGAAWGFVSVAVKCVRIVSRRFV